MLRKLLLSSVVLFVLLSFGFVGSVEADATMWSQVYGGPTYYSARAMVATSDGGYAIAGRIGVNNIDFWLIKTDEYGYMEWNQTYGGPHWEYCNAMVETADGGYAIAGSTHSISQSICDDVLLIKTDEQGNEEWNRTYGGPYWDGANALVATSDGGYALAGYTGSSGAGNTDFWLVKTDMFGNMEWNRTWWGEADADIARSLIETSDGGYAVLGTTGSFGAVGEDFWLVKTDAFGNMEWNRTIGGPGGDGGHSLVEVSDGGYVLAGSANSLGFGGADAWLVKTDEFGNVEWNQTYGGATDDLAYSLVVASDGGYAIAGVWDYADYVILDNGEEVAHGSFWLVKTDEFGNMEWNRTYGESDLNVAYSLVATSDGGYAMAGEIRSLGFTSADLWLVKTDETGFVPEHPSFILSSLLMTATLVIVIYKKKPLNQP